MTTQKIAIIQQTQWIQRFFLLTTVKDGIIRVMLDCVKPMFLYPTSYGFCWLLFTRKLEQKKADGVD